MDLKNFIPTLKYINIIIKHKLYVYIAGRKLKVPIINLILHDLSKFSLKELPHYGRNFCGSKNDPQGFSRAWLHHQNINKHHWEYWVSRSGIGYNKKEVKPLDIPENYVREMIADWIGAGKAYSGSWPNIRNWFWLSENIDKLILSDKTKSLLFSIIDELIEKGEFQ